MNLTLGLVLVVIQSNGQTTGLIRQEKQRVIVLTDITNEPDDQESLVRFLVYANEYDIEGIVATTSVWLKDKVRPEKILACIDAYGHVRDNLEKHATGYPSAKYLTSITKAHLPLYGMNGVGQGKDSEGSELIIRAVDKDDARPVWISVWGGAGTLAQALWKVKNTRTPEEVRKFVSKLKVYAISDQDDAGRWIRNNFTDVFYIVSPSAEDWLEYYHATWTGISGDRHYKNGPLYKFELVDNPWLKANIINNHGPLGAQYPEFAYIMEGDTPSFIGLISNGLGSAISPAYGGWGGRYDLFQSYAEARPIWTNTINSVDAVDIGNGTIHSSDQASIWRWREAFQNDFAARMDWSVSPLYKSANHNPVVAVNGDTSKDVMTIRRAAGEVIRLSAKGSTDPDQNSLAYNWFLYREAGKFSGVLNIENRNSEEISFALSLLKDGESLHIICEVKDNGTPALFSYRRIIIRN